MKTYAIIVCGGNSNRAGQDKILVPIRGRAVLAWTLDSFERAASIDAILLVGNAGNMAAIKELARERKKIIGAVLGGLHRNESVHNGVISINPSKEDILAIHNGANPLVNPSEIDACVTSAKKYGSAVLGYPVHDSLRRVKDGIIIEALDRRDVWQMQTPQCFRADIYFTATKTTSPGLHTDEASLVLSSGKQVHIVLCSHKNIKLTSAEDFEIAEALLLKNRVEGIGEDSHVFENGRSLVIGGVNLPSPFGFKANSDGDVALHALCNAIMSALGGRSLGSYADEMAKEGNINSVEFLKHTLKEAKEKGYIVGQVTFSFVGLKPNIEEIHDTIKASLSRLLSLPYTRIGITATTGDNLSAFGKGEGMHCFCHAILEKTQ